jgi:GTP-binding protein YchF
MTKSQSAAVGNFPFCTIDPNVGIVNVPDKRVDVLANLDKPAKIIYATVKFVDIAGLLKGASLGEGLGNKFLSHIHEVDTIIHVIRCFENEKILHSYNRIAPIEDKNIIDTELQIKDLELLEKKIEKVNKLIKSGNKDSGEILKAGLTLKKYLEQGENSRNLILTEEQNSLVQELQLLTAKPIVYVANVDEQILKVGGNKFVEELKKIAAEEKTKVIMLAANIESDLLDLLEEDKKLFLAEYNIQESGLDQLAKAAYEKLGLVTFFTSGSDETRAWTIKKGTKAPQAAGVIHSDFERGFIKAEVVKFEDYVSFGGGQKCKEQGKLNIEGKDYVMEDGDIVNFKFNV